MQGYAEVSYSGRPFKTEVIHWRDWSISFNLILSFLKNILYSLFIPASLWRKRILVFSFFSFSDQAKDYSAKKKKEMKQKISFHFGKRNDYGGELSKKWLYGWYTYQKLPTCKCSNLKKNYSALRKPQKAGRNETDTALWIFTLFSFFSWVP